MEARKVLSYSLNCVKKKNAESICLFYHIVNSFFSFLESKHVLLLHIVFNLNNPMTSFSVQYFTCHWQVVKYCNYNLEKVFHPFDMNAICDPFKPRPWYFSVFIHLVAGYTREFSICDIELIKFRNSIKK